MRPLIGGVALVSTCALIFIFALSQHRGSETLWHSSGSSSTPPAVASLTLITPSTPVVAPSVVAPSSSSADLASTSRRLPAVANYAAALEQTSFYASLWAVLQPTAVDWAVSWPDVFGGSAAKMAELPQLGKTSEAADGGATKQSSDMEALMERWNEGYVVKPENWTTALSDDLPALKVMGAFWAASDSKKEESISLVTTCNLVRLDQLRAQCKSWPGQLNVALHHPVLQDEPGNLTEAGRSEVKSALQQVANLLAEMHQTPSACKLRVMLAVEVYTEKRAMILFPVNVLRNLARLQADTPLIALLDVDLLPSASLYARAIDAAQSKDLIDQGVSNNTVYVVPGFEVHKEHEHAPWADALVSGGKEIVSAAYTKGVVVAFHVDRYPAGHTPTNYSLWMDTDKDYTIQYKAGYEPWLIGARVGMPWHDARYRGFGKNKVQHILNLCLLNYTFTVMHDVYAVHRPHEASSSAVTFLTKMDRKSGTNQKNELKTRMFSLLDLQEAAGLDFKPVVSPATTRCYQQLPWWTQGGAGTGLAAAAATPQTKAEPAVSQPEKAGRQAAQTTTKKDRSKAKATSSARARLRQL